MTRILVIDDEDQVRSMLRQMLEREGYEVLEAPNGKVGIDLCRQEPSDLVITDIIMPDKEGIETILDLRRDFPDVRIIAISGGGRIRPENHLHLAAAAGVLRTLAKPFTRQEILQAVAELVEEKAAEQAG